MQTRLRDPAARPRRHCSATRLCRYILVAAIVVLALGWVFIQSRIWPEKSACEVLEQQTPRLTQSRLPKIIHQVWPRSKAMPASVRKWFVRWNELFPDTEHRLWSDEDIRDLIKKRFPWFLKTFDSYPENIMRADAARTFILYAFGGLYADMDYEPLVNFWDRLPDDAPSLVESYWKHEENQNSFMVSPPKHEFWNYTWTLMMARDKELGPEKYKMDTVHLTGPGLLDGALVEYRKAHPESPIHTLSCQNWHRVSTGYQTNRYQGLIRLWQYYFDDRVFKKCGSVYDSRCQLGVHYSRTMWLDD